MPLSKIQKQKIVEDLREKMTRQKAIVLVGISGLKVKDLSELREKVKAINGAIKVAKKTLAEIVFKENKLDFAKGKFKDEVAFVFGFKDEVLPAKTVYQFSRANDKLKILGGYLENKFRTSQDVIALAQLPGREELLAKMVGSIAAPTTGLVSVLAGNIKGLLTVLTKIKQ